MGLDQITLKEILQRSNLNQNEFDEICKKMEEANEPKTASLGI